MGLFSFLRDAGARLTGHGAAMSAPTPEALLAELARLNLPTQGLHIEIKDDTARLTGSVADAAMREKIVLAVGNVQGVGRVDDQLQGGEAQAGGSLGGAIGSLAGLPAGSASAAGARDAVHAAATQPVESGPGGSAFYTVQKGDTLSAIAKKHYGDANKYPQVFEANKPMLDSPDKIYPGQVLRLPALG